MRLVDADTYLEKVCTYKETGCGSCKFSTVCPVDAPTVEAIPVDWLKAKAEKWASRNDVLMWGQCVQLLIEDWGKENEANR